MGNKINGISQTADMTSHLSELALLLIFFFCLWLDCQQR